ncbi:unnamed protein product [Effrenium voratum]|nr:unnamed protein product [Effrenium voratum]
MAPKKSAAAKAKTQPADVKKEQKTKARRAAKSKAAAPDVPEVTEELYKRAHNALSYQIRKGGDAAGTACQGVATPSMKSFAEHSTGTALQWLHTFTQHTIFETSQSAEKRGQWFSRWQVAAAMGNPPDALVKKKLQVLRFRDARDETLKAMGEPEYCHQESMHTRTMPMKRLEGGIRRLNKLSASSLRLRARAPEDGALAKSLLDTETTISRLVFDHQKSLRRGEQDKDCTQWLAQQLADPSAAEKDIGDVLTPCAGRGRLLQFVCVEIYQRRLVRAVAAEARSRADSLFAKREPELLEALPEGQDTSRANLSRRHHALAAALTRQVACGSYEFPQWPCRISETTCRAGSKRWMHGGGQSPQVADALDEIEIKAVSGGVSALVAASLDALCNSYWPLDAQHEQRLPLRIANLLADEAAIRACYASKGAAGWKKPCLACANVCMKRSDISEARGAGLITICDSGPFVSHTSETIWQMADELGDMHRSGACSRAEIEASEKAFGLSHEPLGLLRMHNVRRLLPPIETLTYDGMHVLLSNGVALLEAQQDLSALEEPRHCKIRSALRGRARTTWKPAAAELLAAYPILALFAEKVTQGILPRETASLLRMRDILGMYQRLKIGELPVNAESTATFTAAVHAHHAALHAAYGPEIMVPKHHILHHFGPQILRDGMVLDCFPTAVERKHRLLKAYASHLRSGPGFERGIFARSILASAHIAVAAREDALLRGEVLCEDDTNILVSHHFYWKQDLYTADDVVLARGVPVSLVCGLLVDERMAAVVAPLEFLSKSATFSTWRQRRDSPVKVHCLQDGLRLALGWQRRGDIVKIIAW